MVGNDLGFFAYVGKDQPRNVWRICGLTQPYQYLKNRIGSHGIHGPDEAYDINTGERVMNRKTLYASKVFSTKDTFVVHKQGQAENKFIAVGPARFSRNKCGFNTANEIPNMDLTDVAGTNTSLRCSSVIHSVFWTGVDTARSRRFSNVKHIK